MRRTRVNYVGRNACTSKQPKYAQQQVKPKLTTNVNADLTVITIESLNDYSWDNK